jgi:hypothetical protein
MNHFFLTIQITAPKEITILMSAISLGSETDSKDNSKIKGKNKMLRLSPLFFLSQPAFDLTCVE